MAKAVILLFTIAIICNTCTSSPFDTLQNYIESYKHGITRLKREAAEYHPKEDSFAEKIEHTKTISDIEQYDFIIIGGGTSGSVLAGRLSEVPEFRVLLLEAGDEETEITKIPAMYHTLTHTHNSWGYKSIPQKNWCKGNKYHKAPITSGKILGGTSSINEMIYTRGNARDYNLWADQGVVGWCFDHVLPYFKKSEDANLHHFDRQHHNQGGLYNVEEPKYSSKITKNFMNASKELGYKNVDYNGKQQIGVASPQMNIKDGKRSSTYEAFVKPYISKRDNLVVRHGAQVVEILMGPHTKEVFGVKYLYECEKGLNLYEAKAANEVILSSGALNSPQILMLSGVGPKETLEKLGIECKVDLPVGKNLKDQPSFSLNYKYKGPDCQSEDEDLVEYLRDKKGSLTSSGIEGLLFIRTNASTGPPEYPDSYVEFLPKKDSYDLRISLAHPKSVGQITLKTKDKLHWPSIDLNQFSDVDNHDILTMVSAIREAQRLSKTPAFKKAGVVFNDHPVKGCEDLKFDTDQYWRCAVRHDAVSRGHYTGSCTMGKEKESSVVNNELKVHGVHKLRVADGSVIPSSITGHPQAAVVMVAEKAADLIKSTWLKGVPTNE